MKCDSKLFLQLNYVEINNILIKHLNINEHNLKNSFHMNTSLMAIITVNNTIPLPIIRHI